ncbi:MAG: nitrilase-related carbon-nitrogen hydrolase [Pyrinomonadaceae bacterium]
MHQITCRQYAFEGRCFVLAVGSIMLSEDLPDEFPLTVETDSPSYLLRGGSCVISPDGSYVVEPVFDVEIIITAEIDLSMIDRETMTLDVSGHYHRPDVFDFSVKRGRRNGNA